MVKSTELQKREDEFYQKLYQLHGGEKGTKGIKKRIKRQANFYAALEADAKGTAGGKTRLTELMASERAKKLGYDTLTRRDAEAQEAMLKRIVTEDGTIRSDLRIIGEELRPPPEKDTGAGAGRVEKRTSQFEKAARDQLEAAKTQTSKAKEDAAAARREADKARKQAAREQKQIEEMERRMRDLERRFRREDRELDEIQRELDEQARQARQEGEEEKEEQRPEPQRPPPSAPNPTSPRSRVYEQQRAVPELRPAAREATQRKEHEADREVVTVQSTNPQAPPVPLVNANSAYLAATLGTVPTQEITVDDRVEPVIPLPASDMRQQVDNVADQKETAEQEKEDTQQESRDINALESVQLLANRDNEGHTITDVVNAGGMVTRAEGNDAARAVNDVIRDRIDGIRRTIGDMMHARDGARPEARKRFDDALEVLENELAEAMDELRGERQITTAGNLDNIYEEIAEGAPLEQYVPENTLTAADPTGAGAGAVSYGLATGEDTGYVPDSAFQAAGAPPAGGVSYGLAADAPPRAPVRAPVRAPEKGRGDRTMYDVSAFGAGQPAELPNASQMIANTAQPNEDARRQRMSDAELREEIRALLLVYRPLIEPLRTTEAMRQADDALRTRDRRRLMSYHEALSTTIRRYYQSSQLAVGVIVDPSSLPQMGGGTAARGAQRAGASSRFQTIRSGEDAFTHSDFGQQEVMRGGRNSFAILENRIPQSDPLNVPQPSRLSQFMGRPRHPFPRLKFATDPAAGMDLNLRHRPRKIEAEEY